MIKAIIFDCFGVLVGRGFAETYRLAGGDPTQDATFIEDMLMQANRGTLTYDEFYAGMAEKLAISVQDFETAVNRAEQPDAELLAYIAELHTSYKTAILSNANIGTLERKIDKTILTREFDALVVSAEVGHVKPEAEIYHLVASKLGVEPEECVFTDDQPRYCDAAREVGMQAIVYRSLDQFRIGLQQILAK